MREKQRLVRAIDGDMWRIRAGACSTSVSLQICYNSLPPYACGELSK